MKNLFVACLLLTATPLLGSAPHRHFVVIGSAPYHESTMQKISEWGGGKKARILVIAWGAYDAESSFEYLKNWMEDFEPQSVDLAPLDMPKEKKKFLGLLNKATVIFFTGGSQNWHMNAIRESGIREAFVKRYKEGAVFAGSSAGAALLSKNMFTGAGDYHTVIDPEEADVEDGLGLTDNVIFDQHFITRSPRYNRMYAYLQVSPEKMGVGVESEAALAVEDEKSAEVIGNGKVMTFVKTAQPGQYLVSIFDPGQKFVLDDSANSWLTRK